MATLLFRQEVLDAQTAQYLGEIRIGRNPRHITVAVVAVFLASALAAFAIWGQVTRKVRVPGLLVPAFGTLQINTTVSGVVTERRVVEGDFVKTGQVLFVLGTDRTGVQGDTALLVAQSLRERRKVLQAERDLRELQARQRLQSLGERQRAVEVEVLRAQTEAQFAERRVILANKSVDRFHELAGKGFVSEVQAQTKEEELIDLLTRSQIAQRTITALLKEQKSLEAEQLSTDTQLKTDLMQLNGGLAALAQDSIENEARRKIVVTAPQAGMVTALHAQLGGAVIPGHSLATLVPQSTKSAIGELHVELYAPSRTTGFVQHGQEVWLRYAAFPYQKFGMGRGTVESVSRTPVSAQELPPGQAHALQVAAQSSEPLYRIKVVLATQNVIALGQELELRPGMSLEADVVQERRAVWEWILEPVLALRQRV